ncbi:hypothetical protein Taro_050174 [Colocasia esculenta]|uniref:START domain-containing protein n=1 Tax=Colocasia esculenta TaxID=4460 RepID=A0A843XDD1_COLES|nr:hypothetical protein [Colocasia esculenta]
MEGGAPPALAAEERRVCVTGGNGFIGTWLVRALLQRGYSVTATYQPGTDPSHLLSLPGAEAPGRLVLREADLLDAAAIVAAVGGCRHGVFHVASPCTLEDPQDPETELLAPAVQGTLNMLEAARGVGSRRVVLTSSISAMVPNPQWALEHPGRVLDEDSWTDLDYCKSRQKWYPVSKTLAEKAAWEYAEKHGIDLVAIHPSTCLGALLQPGLNASSAVIQQLLKGSNDTQEYHWLGCVHVKDVAAAQVFSEETQPGLVGCQDAAKRLISLGLTFTPIEEAIKDSVGSLKEKGFLAAPEIFNQWDPHLVEANYIKGLNDNLSIIRLRFGDASKPLFKNREFIVYERRETMDDGTLVVAVASLPKEIAAGLQPKNNNSIRGLLLQSGWVVEKMDDDSCIVTYVVQLDPAGWLPKCFVNRLNTKLVMIIDNLKKMAQACPVNDGM